MKNTNLLLTTVLFSSLLAGCGMTGPLYRTPEPAAEEQKTSQAETESAQKDSEIPLQNDSQNTVEEVANDAISTQ